MEVIFVVAAVLFMLPLLPLLQIRLLHGVRRLRAVLLPLLLGSRRCGGVAVCREERRANARPVT